MMIPVEELKEICWGDSERFVVVEKEATGRSRWAIEYEMTFKEKATGKLYGSGYRMGTGDEGERPYEHDGDEDQECPEMEAYEVTMTKYRAKK